MILPVNSALLARENKMMKMIETANGDVISLAANDLFRKLYIMTDQNTSPAIPNSITNINRPLCGGRLLLPEVPGHISPETNSEELLNGL